MVMTHLRRVYGLSNREWSRIDSIRFDSSRVESEQTKVVVAIGNRVEHVPKRSPTDESRKTC
ncbi:hypothetical protein P3T25_006510 [Paraburkholderia sp. GAS32]